MTLAEIAANAEKAVDALTTALNDQPSDNPEVVDRLKGIVHGVMLALCAIAQDAGGDAADRAGEAGDALLTVYPLLDDLAEAMREAAYRRVIAA